MSRRVGKLVEEGVVIKSDEELESKGFGTLRGKRMLLSPVEALYLVEKSLLEVKEGERALSFRELTDRFIRNDPDLMSRYLIYRDLRERGYVVKGGYGFGVDFLVYDRGTYGKKPAKMLIVGVNEGEPIPVRQLAQAVEIALGSKKELRVAVLDRRGEVIYYSLSEFFPKGGE